MKRPKTLAERYNREMVKLMPGLAADLRVDPKIDSAEHIDEIIFRRSEYFGGMAAVILAIVEKNEAKRK